MKKLIFFLSSFIVVVSHLRAQLPNTFTTNHPTVASVKVSYKQSPQTSTVQSSVPSIPVIPQVTVSLVPGADVAKIYFVPQYMQILLTVNNKKIFTL